MSKFSKACFVAAALGVSAMPGLAQAFEPVLASVQPYDCVPVTGGSGTMDNALLLERTLARNNVAIVDRSEASRRSLAASVIANGQAALQEEADRALGREIAQPLRGEARARGDLYLALAPFVTGLEQTPTIRVDTPPMPSPIEQVGEETRRRVEHFLTGRADWLRVSCQPPRPQTRTPEPARDYLSRTRVAQTLSGARGALANSDYATFSGRWDSETQVDTFSFEGVALFAPVTASEHFDLNLRPYIGFHRVETDHPAKEINNLTFGGDITLTFDGASTRSWAPAAHYLSISLEYLTDDHLESSMTRGEITYMPTWAGTIGDDRRIACLGGECSWSLAGVLDYAEVHDATGKPKLEEVEQYGRIGANLGAAYYFGPPNAWELSLSADYRVREDLSDEGGDADLLKVRLAFTPSQAGHLSFGVDYLSGETLTTLEDQEVWGISLGVRF